MQTNDPQRAKWSDLQGNNNQPFNNPNGGVEHGSDVNASLKTASSAECEFSSQIFTRASPSGAPEKNDCQKVPKVDVSENICEERRRQNNKPDFGNRSDCSPNAAVGFSGSAGRCQLRSTQTRKT